jgi:hypothetical protein
VCRRWWKKHGAYGLLSGLLDPVSSKQRRKRIPKKCIRLFHKTE